ncbi:MAG: hypothetical protein FWC98_03960, partial [Bacteroidales bacterium]|nr:hypothetical protein [Bacteroidales bacterium]
MIRFIDGGDVGCVVEGWVVGGWVVGVGVGTGIYGGWVVVGAVVGGCVVGGSTTGTSTVSLGGSLGSNPPPVNTAVLRSTVPAGTSSDTSTV